MKDMHNSQRGFFGFAPKNTFQFPDDGDGGTPPPAAADDPPPPEPSNGTEGDDRSEEHTSELQSH